MMNSLIKVLTAAAILGCGATIAQVSGDAGVSGNGVSGVSGISGGLGIDLQGSNVPGANTSTKKGGLAASVEAAFSGDGNVGCEDSEDC